MKIDLYIDFDGVILDTIDVASSIYFKNKKQIGYPPRSFYEKLDWNDLLDKCHEINKSINNITKLINSNLFNVRVLTHIVCENERIAKIKYLNEKIPGLEVVTVFKEYNKCDVVNAKKSILVDDYSENLELWQKAGGIPIKFSTKNKKYNYITINSLDHLIEIFPKLIALVQ